MFLGCLVSIEIPRDKHLMVARMDGSCGTGGSEKSYESYRVYGWDVFDSAAAESVGEWWVHDGCVDQEMASSCGCSCCQGFVYDWLQGI